MELFLKILFNIGTITSFGVISILISYNQSIHRKMPFLHGFIYGTGAVIGMLHPVVFKPGVIFDGRSILISIAGLFFGPIAAFIAAAMAILLRIYQGGSGIWMGCLSSLIAAFIGSLYYFRYTFKNKSLTTKQIYFFGIWVHVFLLMGTLTLPKDIILETLYYIGPSMMIIYPLATLLLGKIVALVLSKNQMVKELQKSESLLKSSQKLTKAGGWEWDLQKKTMYWTEETYRIHGLKLDLEMQNNRELIEKSISCYYPSDRKKLLEAFNKCSSEGISYNIVLPFLSYDDKKKWVRTTAKAILNEDGAIDKVIGNLIDITDQVANEKRIVENKKKYQDLFSNMLEGFAYHQIVLNDRGKPIDYIFLEVNQAMQQFTGLKAEEIIGKKVTTILPGIQEDEVKWIEIYGEVALSGKSIIFEAYSKPLQKWFSISAYSFEKGFFATVFSDITSQKQTKIQLQQLNQELDEKVRQRTKDLEESNASLEAFSYSVSHDLRAPLRAIQGFSNILLEDYSNTLPKDALRLLGIIHDNTKKMDQLIKGLLHISKVSKSALQKTQLNMQEIVEECIQDIIPPEKRSTMTIHLHPLPTASGDIVLIRQVWWNLIDNAVKFSSNHPRPILIIDGKQKSEGNEYTVKDNGVGFNEEYKEKLFTLFQRLHTSEEFQGTGIGLALVKQIVQKHGGKIWAKGGVNEGAEFTFSLPH
ncbi:MAG TPA: LytS/YhcK type 5TM receptor domain-containing protein [Caldisericia bacterium]|nr:LytS/YhcK type 5TM receptor domain-containing protein [Caldisericia bacterium]